MVVARWWLKTGSSLLVDGGRTLVVDGWLLNAG